MLSQYTAAPVRAWYEESEFSLDENHDSLAKLDHVPLSCGPKDADDELGAGPTCSTHEGEFSVSPTVSVTGAGVVALSWRIRLTASDFGIRQQICREERVGPRDRVPLEIRQGSRNIGQIRNIRQI